MAYCLTSWHYLKTLIIIFFTSIANSYPGISGLGLTIKLVRLSALCELGSTRKASRLLEQVGLTAV